MNDDTIYNGWVNEETWLVSTRYMNSMPEYFADMDQRHVYPDELEEAVRYIAEECEALSQLPAGLLSDFISMCWSKVDWRSLAKQLNNDLAGMAGYL